MKIPLLTQLNADNRAAALYFATFARRRRSFTQIYLQDVIDLGRRNNLSLEHDEVRAFFAGLEEAQCGQSVSDEQGARFLWTAKATEVSRLARDTVPTPVPAASSHIKGVTHVLRLREDCDLTLELPADFSPAEARRLCHFIIALPLDPVESAPLPE